MKLVQAIFLLRRRKAALVFGVSFAAVVVLTLRWLSLDVQRGIPASSNESGVAISKSISRQCDENSAVRPDGAAGGVARPPVEFRSRATDPAAVLASGKETVDERVRRLRNLRGKGFSGEEHRAGLAFLAGKNVPEGMGKASVHWLADELLTVMRLQEPPAAGLVGELGEIAFQAETNPVVRDYIMQHLGHLWEQFGAREEIEKSLWRAVASSDQTTPGTALIALSRGYQRDQQPENLQKVRAQALALLQNPTTGLAVRVTALAIAGDGGSQEVKTIAQDLAQNPETPLILKRVAERIAGK